MIYLELFWAFCKIGFFAIGGGLATVPFLFDLSAEKGWFSVADLVKMIAVSEATPGPLGVNMATYTGVQTAGVSGGIISTVGLVVPMFVVIVVLSHCLKHFRKNKWLDAIFEGLRPAVAMMILSFVIGLFIMNYQTADHMGRPLLAVLLSICYVILTWHFRGHPVLFITLAAVMGIICG